MRSYLFWCLLFVLRNDNYAVSFTFGNIRKQWHNKESLISLTRNHRHLSLLQESLSLTGEKKLWEGCFYRINVWNIKFDENLMYFSIDRVKNYPNWTTIIHYFEKYRQEINSSKSSTDLSDEILSIVENRNTSDISKLVFRPGYTFGLGCSKWEASSYSGTIEGWSAEPIIQWLVLCYRFVCTWMDGHAILIDVIDEFKLFMCGSLYLSDYLILLL